MCAPVAINGGLNSSILLNNQSAVILSKNIILDEWEQGGEGEVQTFIQDHTERIATIAQFNPLYQLWRINSQMGWTEWNGLKTQVQQAKTRLDDLSDNLKAQLWRKQLRSDQWNSFQQQITDSKSRIDDITEAIGEWELKASPQNRLKLENTVARLRQLASISSSPSSSVFEPLSQFTNILSHVISSGVQLLIAAGVIAATALSGSWIPPAVALSTALLLAGAFFWSQLIEQEKADQFNLTEAQALILYAWRKVKKKMDTGLLIENNEKLDFIISSLCSSQNTQSTSSTSKVNEGSAGGVAPNTDQALEKFAKQLVRDGLVNENMSLRDLTQFANRFKQKIQAALEELEQAQEPIKSTNTITTETVQLLETQAATQQI